jgi:hypothetical protein
MTDVLHRPASDRDGLPWRTVVHWVGSAPASPCPAFSCSSRMLAAPGNTPGGSQPRCPSSSGSSRRRLAQLLHHRPIGRNNGANLGALVTALLASYILDGVGYMIAGTFLVPADPATHGPGRAGRRHRPASAGQCHCCRRRDRCAAPPRGQKQRRSSGGPGRPVPYRGRHRPPARHRRRRPLSSPPGRTQLTATPHPQGDRDGHHQHRP